MRIPMSVILAFALLILPILKLDGHITWSWWWVTAPAWGTVLGAGLLATLLIVGTALMATKNNVQG